MKLYMALNMHYPLPELFARQEVTLMLKRDAKSVAPDLDQNVVEVTIDFPESEVTKQDVYYDITKDMEKPVNLVDLPLGLYDRGVNWTYKGDPTKITNTRIVKKARLPIIEDIPRVSIVAVVDKDALNSTHWYHHADVLATIERYMPKWGAKGYIYGKIGNDKIRLDYVPLTVNPTAVATLITSLMGFGEAIMEQLPGCVSDHGSKQEFMDHF
jgi:hypothetical protein